MMELFGKILFEENEEDGQNQAEEGGYVIPMEGLALEKDGDNDSEDHERDSFLNHFKLHKAKRASVAREAETVGRNLGTIFKKCDTPGKEDDQNKWPTGGDLHLLKFQMAVPGECHKYVGQHQQKNGSYCSHCLANEKSDAKVVIFIGIFSRYGGRLFAGSSQRRYDAAASGSC